MNNYYDDILEYGITYGIDPSIIAALMMQEGSNIYDPTQSEDYYKIGFGQVNGSIWDGQSITVYNFVTQSYETYKINVMLLYNNPKEQIKLIAIMLQDNAVRYSGNLNAMFICYNQGMGTVSNIANSKNNPFSRLLTALGIRFVGAKASKVIAKYVKNMDNLMKATKDELLKIDDVGSAMAESIIQYFSQPQNVLSILVTLFGITGAVTKFLQ